MEAPTITLIPTTITAGKIRPLGAIGYARDLTFFDRAGKVLLEVSILSHGQPGNLDIIEEDDGEDDPRIEEFGEPVAATPLESISFVQEVA